MKKKLLILILLLSCSIILCSEALSFYYGESGPPGHNDVHVGNTAIAMPLNKILLVRKESQFCSIKFIQYWTDKTGNDLYAEYELYYQEDKGNFGDVVSIYALLFATCRETGKQA
ncbi:MAG: hypothetical protein WC880_05195 [Candidatus Paceibacterota bacterium]